MKRLGWGGMLIATLLLAGCEGSRHGVPCIGFPEKEKPGVEYEISTRNVIVGVVFFETVWVPVVVALKEVKCPVQP